MKKLLEEQTLVILAYADAGLGHLRVTNALWEGLPKQVNPILLRSGESTIKSLHRLTSSHPLFTGLLKWSQEGKQEEIITDIYVDLLRRNSKEVQKQLENIIEQKMHLIHKVVVICTHFGLAHQIAEVKKAIETKWKLEMFLGVCVTDDSPQKIWYVPEADLVTVPSKNTKRQLGKHDNIKVNQYPVSPILGKKLTSEEFKQKLRQVDPDASDVINVSIPISGASVGLDFASQIMKNLHRKNERFVFNVVVHDNLFTHNFIEKNQRRDYVSVLESSHTRRVVRLYDKMFINSILSIEITKPSEQCFKALFNPHQRGGVVLLLTEPVGRQEYDNLDYLLRNRLMPSDSEYERLLLYAENIIEFSDKAKESLEKKARKWRALKIPSDTRQAASFINWCLKNNIFSGMMHSKIDKSHGVEKFWKTIDALV